MRTRSVDEREFVTDIIDYSITIYTGLYPHAGSSCALRGRLGHGVAPTWADDARIGLTGPERPSMHIAA